MKTNYLFVLFVLSILSCSPKYSTELNQVKDKNYNVGWSKLDNYPIKYGRSDDLHFFNEHEGLVINSEGYLSYTKDGGENWEIVHENKGTFFRCIEFKNRQEGWLGTIGTDDPHLSSSDTIAMYETKDGGLTWSPVKFEGPNPKGLCGLQKVNDDLIVGCGRVRGPSYFIKTVDGGKIWQSQNLDHVAGSLIAAHFFDQDNGLLIGGTTRDKENSRSLVLSTEDGGISWDTVYLSEQKGEYPWKFAFPNRNKGFISIQRNVKDGQFYHLQTKDGGKNWKEVVHSKDYYYVQGIGFLNERIGYMGGSNRKTYETRDGGNTWTPYANIGNGFNNFQFFENGTAYGTGFGVFKSDNVLSNLNLIESHFENGQIESSYQIQNGKRYGMAKTFYENGKIKSKGQYENNLKIGKWQYFDTKGNLEHKTKMFTGQIRVSQRKLASYLGSYVDEKGISRHLTLNNGILYSQREDGDQFAIFPEAPDQFYFAFDPEIKYHFVRDAGKKISGAIFIRSNNQISLTKK